jgi:hypothetical protein
VEFLEKTEKKNRDAVHGKCFRKNIVTDSFPIEFSRLLGNEIDKMMPSALCSIWLSVFLHHVIQTLGNTCAFPRTKLSGAQEECIIAE